MILLKSLLGLLLLLFFYYLWERMNRKQVLNLSPSGYNSIDQYRTSNNRF